MFSNCKPPRMRTACTECHASKVRCDSNKAGCARCVQNNLDCVYKVSMVGRTSKKRHAPNEGSAEPDHRRKGTNSTGQNAADQFKDVDGDSNFLCSPTTSASSDTPSAPLPEFIDPVNTQFLAATDYGSSLSLDDFSATAPSQLDFSAGPVENWWEPAGGGGGAGDDGGSCGGGGGGGGPFPEGSHRSGSGPTRSLGAGPQHANSASSHSALPGLPDHADSAADDEGRRRLAQLMSLCRKARQLEGQLQSRLSTVDEIMKMNKTCLAEIFDMTGAKREGREGKKGGRICRCSLAIMATCLDTMLTLFENVLKASWLNPRGGSQSSPPGEPCMPSLHFGVFEVDPVDQAAIARRILARELRSYRDVVRMLAATLNSQSGDMFHRLMGQWCLSLTARVERLPIMLDVE